MLCEFCSCLDLTQAASDVGMPHHENYANLLASAECGCELCAAIQKQCGESDIDHYLNDPERLICHFDGAGSFLYWQYESPQNSEWLATFYVCAQSDDSIATTLYSRPLAPDTKSDQFFETVHDWMLECQQYHPECRRSLNSRLPSRVIDVEDEGKDPFLFVSHDQPGQWITLSHCWGQQNPPMTTLANIEDRCKQIALKDMPQLFQDAIQITRRLGHRYLWIDSLCILQDSIDDWRKESIRMGEIYSEAQLTIAAEACTNSLDGIFHKANALRPRGVIEVPVRVSDQGLHGHVLLDMQPIRSAQESKGPLSTRLWTLQENLLSRRTLLFAEEQVWWQCREMQRSERRPQWESFLSNLEPGSQLTPQGQWDAQNVFPLTSMSSRIKGMAPEHQLAFFQPLQCWYRTVNAFCLRKATYRSDTFPAISGIAREYYRHLWQDYKAGLWNEDIHMGLVWSVTHPGVAKPTSYVAPSFSWAALDFSAADHLSYSLGGAVYDHMLIDYPPTNLKAKIIAMSIRNTTSDPFGQVEGGTIQLIAPCTDVCSCAIQKSFFDCHPSGQHSSLNYDVLLRGYRFEALDTPVCDQCTVDYHLGRKCSQEITMIHKQYLYVHILSHSHEPAFAFALILTRAPGNTEVYERQGLAILKETMDTTVIWPSRTVTIV